MLLTCLIVHRAYIFSFGQNYKQIWAFCKLRLLSLDVWNMSQREKYGFDHINSNSAMVTRRIPDPKIGGSIPSGVKFFGFLSQWAVLAQFGRAFDFKSIGRGFDPPMVLLFFEKTVCRVGSGGVVGYHASLTHWRSRVRSSPQIHFLSANQLHYRTRLDIIVHTKKERAEGGIEPLGRWPPWIWNPSAQKCRVWGSNSRPLDYETNALPTEPTQLVISQVIGGLSANLWLVVRQRKRNLIP